jgi:hypothetical protein
VDLWSLGAVVGEMLTKQPVFNVGKTVSMLCIRIRSEPQHFPGSAAAPRAFQAVRFQYIAQNIKNCDTYEADEKVKIFNVYWHCCE